MGDMRPGVQARWLAPWQRCTTGERKGENGGWGHVEAWLGWVWCPRVVPDACGSRELRVHKIVSGALGGRKAQRQVKVENVSCVETFNAGRAGFITWLAAGALRDKPRPVCGCGGKTEDHASTNLSMKQSVKMLRGAPVSGRRPRGWCLSREYCLGLQSGLNPAMAFPFQAARDVRQPAATGGGACRGAGQQAVRGGWGTVKTAGLLSRRLGV